MWSVASAWLVLALGTNPYLPQGRQAYLKLDYDRAEASLRLAQKVPGNSADEQREVDDLLARTLIAQGRLEEAEDVYRALLVRDPAAPAPVDAAPKIQKLFLKTKKKLYPERYVTLSLRPAPPATVAVVLFDPWSEVKAVRCAGQPLAIEADAHEAHGGCAAGSTVTALDGKGEKLAELVVPGTAVSQTPVALTPVATPSPRANEAPADAVAVQAVEPSRSVFKRPALYVGIGAVVLGAVAVGLAVSAKSATQGLNDPATAYAAHAAYQRASDQTLAAEVVGGTAVAAAATSALLFGFGP